MWLTGLTFDWSLTGIVTGSETPTGIAYSIIEQDVMTNLGRSDSGTRTTIMSMYNLFQEYLVTLGPWEDLDKTKTLTLESGTNTYTLSSLISSSLHKIHTIKIFDEARWWQPLDYVSNLKWDNAIAPLIHSGDNRPEVYTVRGYKLYVYPTPDEDYTTEVFYSIYPATVTSVSDNIQFKHLRSLISAAVTGLVWLTLEEETLASTYLSLTIQFLRQLGKDSTTFSQLAVHKTRKDSVVSAYTWLDPFNKGTRGR